MKTLIVLILLLAITPAWSANVNADPNDLHWQLLQTDTSEDPSFPATKYLAVLSSQQNDDPRATLFIMRDSSGVPKVGLNMQYGIAFDCDMCDLRMIIDGGKVITVTATTTPGDKTMLAIMDDGFLHRLRHAHKLIIALPLADRDQEANFDVSGLPKKLP